MRNYYLDIFKAVIGIDRKYSSTVLIDWIFQNHVTYL